MISRKVGFVETPPEIAELMVRLSNTPKDAYVLDTGFGKGVFLEALKKHGYKNIYGIEIDEELYHICKSKFGNFFKLLLGDFLEYTFLEKFDFIIGNPPYVHFNQLPDKIAKKVRTIIKTSEGDIYYAFIIKSISLLKEGGELIYIVPYHFFYNTYAEIVRKTILQNGKLELIIDLDETKLFSDEHPETIIFKFRKGRFNLKEEKIKLLNITTRKAKPREIYNKALKALKERFSNDLFTYLEIPHYNSTRPWSTLVIDFPSYPYVKLGEIAKVGVGLVSGFDKAFLVDKEDSKYFNTEEQKLMMKFVKAKNCKRYIVEGFALYILIDDNIRNEKILIKNYPNVYKKLVKYKKEMSNRYLPKGKKWFNWQALRNYHFLVSNLNKKRIYVPTLDRHPYNRFSLGEEGLLPSGDVLFIQPYDDKDIYFLLGYLNSTFFRKYYLSSGGRRGGRISFTQRLLENAKIPLFSKEIKNKVCEIVIEIISKLKSGEEISDLEKKIDYIIYDALENRRFADSKENKILTLDAWI